MTFTLIVNLGRCDDEDFLIHDLLSLTFDESDHPVKAKESMTDNMQFATINCGNVVSKT